MKKKLQIFISSTFTDLIDERQAAVEAILKSGNIPAGMELFTAGNESQLQVITRWIDESDIYLLILGGRYGTIDETSGQSYIEVEYDYAVSQGKPFFSVVITDEALENKVKKDGSKVLETDNKAKYAIFRKKVLSKMASFFSEAKDIKLAIHEAIPDFKDRYQFSGWVSGDILEENELLRSENIQLRKNVEKITKENETTNNKDISELKEFQEIEKIYNKETVEVFYNEDDKPYTMIEIIHKYKTKLVAGFHNNYQLDGIGKIFFFNILPKLAIHGLASMNKVPNARYQHFALNEKGCRFVAYLEKKELT